MDAHCLPRFSRGSTKSNTNSLWQRGVSLVVLSSHCRSGIFPLEEPTQCMGHELCTMMNLAFGESAAHDQRFGDWVPTCACFVERLPFVGSSILRSLRSQGPENPKEHRPTSRKEMLEISMNASAAVLDLPHWTEEEDKQSRCGDKLLKGNRPKCGDINRHVNV